MLQFVGSTALSSILQPEMRIRLWRHRETPKGGAETIHWDLNETEINGIVNNDICILFFKFYICIVDQ